MPPHEINPKVIEYLTLIDAKFEEAKLKNWARLSTDWGVWSGEMNRDIRKRMADGETPDQFFLIFGYWQEKSRQLDAWNNAVKSSGGQIIAGERRYRKKGKDAAKLKKLLLEGKTPKLNPYERSLAKNIVKKNLKDAAIAEAAHQFVEAVRGGEGDENTN